MKRIVAGQDVVDWAAQRLNNTGDFGRAVGIGLADGSELIAAVLYNGYTGPNICMHVAAVPGRRWLTREYLRACFEYPFVKLGCRRVTGFVDEGNAAARAFDEHLGFVLETRLQGASPDGDLLVYRMWRHECRWLRLRAPTLRKAA